MLIPTLEARSKALIIAPVKSLLPSGGQEWSTSRYKFQQDSLESWQLLQNNTLVPDLAVDCIRSNTNGTQGMPANLGFNQWNAVAVAELEKALERANIPAKDLRNFHDAFCAGRRLSTDNHSYDAKSNELRLNLQYGQLPKIQKQWYAFMSHIRRAVIKPEGIEVVY